MRQLLRSIAEIGAGQGAPQGDANYSDIGIPFVKAGNLQDLTAGGSLDDIQKVSDAVAKSHRLKLYPKGTVLFAKSGMSCLKGYVYVLPQDAYVVSHLACITPKADISEYLKYYFYFHRPNQLVKDSAYPSISLADIGSLEIDTKDENERTEIISILRVVEKIIGLRKQELIKLDDLIKARFVEMFGDPIEKPMQWPTKGLLEFGNCKNGMNFHSGEQRVEIHCLGVGDFQDRSAISDTTALPKVSLNQLPADEAMLHDGDIVFVRSNGNKSLVGRSIVVYPGDVPTTYSGFCIRYRKDSEDVDTTYLLQMLKADTTRKKMAGRGANIQNLNQQILSELRVPIPSKSLQEKYRLFVDQVDKSKSVA